MATHGGPNIVEDGLVFYADPSNTDSWSGPDASPVNSLTSNITGSIVSDTSGSYGLNDSFTFNGTSGYIEFAQSDSLKFGTGDFCISTWYFWRGKDGLGRYDRLWFLGNTHGSNSLSCNVRNTNIFEIRVNDFIRLQTGTNVVINTWQNFVFQRSGGQFQSYFNGVFDTQNSNTENLNNAGDYTFRIGVEGGTPLSSWWDGDIGPVKIYNRALSAQEIKQNFNALNRFGI